MLPATFNQWPGEWLETKTHSNLLPADVWWKIVFHDRKGKAKACQSVQSGLLFGSWKFTRQLCLASDLACFTIHNFPEVVHL